MEENDGERASERVRELLIFSCCCWYDFASEHINRFTIFIAHCKNRVREKKKKLFLYMYSTTRQLSHSYFCCCSFRCNFSIRIRTRAHWPTVDSVIKTNRSC